MSSLCRLDPSRRTHLEGKGFGASRHALGLDAADDPPIIALALMRVEHLQPALCAIGRRLVLLNETTLPHRPRRSARNRPRRRQVWAARTTVRGGRHGGG